MQKKTGRHAGFLDIDENTCRIRQPCNGRQGKVGQRNQSGTFKRPQRVEDSGGKRPTLNTRLKCRGPGERHLADFSLVSHQSAESRMSINRLRSRLRSHARTIQTTKIIPSPATNVTPQPTFARDVHASAATSAASKTIIPVASLISKRSFPISCMNMIVGPAAVRPKPNASLF